MLLFFDRVIDLPSYWQANDPKYPLASELARKVGESITAVIIKMLSGAMPVYALDERDGCVSDVLWSLKKSFIKEFQVSPFSPVIQQEVFLNSFHRSG
jgi:hypothetical protein